MKETIKKLSRAIKPLVAEHRARSLDAYSAQAAFFTFVSLVPLCAVALGVIKALPADLSHISAAVVPALPPLLRAVVSQSFAAAELSPAAVVPASAAITLFAASKGAYSVLRGVRSAYGLSGEGGIKLRLRSLVYTLAFVFMVIVSFSLAVFGKTVERAFGAVIPGLAGIGVFQTLLRVSALFGVMVFSHVLCYRFVPGAKAPLSAALPGALAASAVWLTVSAFYSFYADWYAGSSRSVYGGLAATVLLLLWLYSCMSATVTGGLINSLLSKNGGVFRRK